MAEPVSIERIAEIIHEHPGEDFVLLGRAECEFLLRSATRTDSAERKLFNVESVHIADMIAENERLRAAIAGMNSIAKHQCARNDDGKPLPPFDRFHPLTAATIPATASCSRSTATAA